MRRSSFRRTARFCRRCTPRSRGSTRLSTVRSSTTARWSNGSSHAHRAPFASIGPQWPVGTTPLGSGRAPPCSTARVLKRTRSGCVRSSPRRGSDIPITGSCSSTHGTSGPKEPTSSPTCVSAPVIWRRPAALSRAERRRNRDGAERSARGCPRSRLLDDDRGADDGRDARRFRRGGREDRAPRFRRSRAALRCAKERHRTLLEGARPEQEERRPRPARRARDGEVIDFAIYEAVMKLVESQLTEYAANGTEHQRLGNRLEDTAPRGAYRCGDGAYVALSGSTQEVAERVLRTIGGDALVADPRFRTNADRVANGAALDALIDAFCATRSRDDAIGVLGGAGCAVGPLESIASVFENPQVKARGSLATLHDPELGEVVINSAFPRFERAGAPPLRPGPSVVGADTEEVLARDLGLSAAEVRELEESGVIGRPRDRDTGGSRT